MHFRKQNADLPSIVECRGKGLATKRPYLDSQNLSRIAVFKTYLDVHHHHEKHRGHVESGMAKLLYQSRPGRQSLA